MRNKFSLSTLLIISTFLITNVNAFAKEVSMEKFNKTLHDKLPESIIKSNEISVVNDGAVPPYILLSDTVSMEGASIDLLKAISEILGVKIKHQQVGSLSALLTGVQSGRYDMAIGPVGDSPARQKNTDFIDYAASYSAFIVKKGNPFGIHTYNDICGKNIATQTGGNGVEKLTIYSNECIKEGKPAINILTFKDLPTGVLAVKSERAEAFHAGAAILTYYVSQDKENIELAGVREIDAIPERYHAAIVPKNSPLGPVLLEAIQELFDNGTYMAIMKKWGLEGNALTTPGMNLAK